MRARSGLVAAILLLAPGCYLVHVPEEPLTCSGETLCVAGADEMCLTAPAVDVTDDAACVEVEVVADGRDCATTAARVRVEAAHPEMVWIFVDVVVLDVPAGADAAGYALLFGDACGACGWNGLSDDPVAGGHMAFGVGTEDTRAVEVALAGEGVRYRVRACGGVAPGD